MNILVTGGAGYIGSHTCVALLDAGHKIVVADNLYNSSVDTIYNIEKISNKKVIFYQTDVTDEEKVDAIFSNHRLNGVIHFAGYKAVGESVSKPHEYYYNNLIATLVISRACIKHGVKKLLFSSSATVYGDNKAPFVETMELKPSINPYGETKSMCERILTDISRAGLGLSVSFLRYFNPIGAHESGIIGEAPNGIPNNLLPYILQVASGKQKYLSIFGNDYPTVDGTGIRDYVHVMDVAEGHIAALKHLSHGVNIYNLGTGKGVSVLQLVKTFEEVNNIKIPYKIMARRAGDVAESYAGVAKAKDELGFSAKRDIKQMCRDAWRFELYRCSAAEAKST